jgi:hypothetical protein
MFSEVIFGPGTHLNPGQGKLSNPDFSIGLFMILSCRSLSNHCVHHIRRHTTQAFSPSLAPGLNAFYRWSVGCLLLGAVTHGSLSIRSAVVNGDEWCSRFGPWGISCMLVFGSSERVGRQASDAAS